MLAVASMRDFIIDNPYFSVREIQVRGGDKVSGNEIVTIAGLKQGMNIWKVDPAAIEKKVARHPWVRQVLVRREFPRRIVIDVEERIPKAIVALRKLYYIDADGVVFKEVEAGENVQYPLLTGLRPEGKPIQDSQTNPRSASARRFDGAALALAVGDSFRRVGPVVVYTTKFPVALRMGWGDWEEKLGRMDRLLSLWKGNEAAYRRWT